MSSCKKSWEAPNRPFKERVEGSNPSFLTLMITAYLLTFSQIRGFSYVLLSSRSCWFSLKNADLRLKLREKSHENHTAAYAENNAERAKCSSIHLFFSGILRKNRTNQHLSPVISWSQDSLRLWEGEIGCRSWKRRSPGTLRQSIIRCCGICDWAQRSAVSCWPCSRCRITGISQSRDCPVYDLTGIFT